MNNIIVAFDFSKNAVHALEYALKYANVFGADINLVWVDNTDSRENIIDTIDGEIRIEKKKYLNEIAADYKNKHPKVTIKVILRKGKVYQEIAKTARQLKSELIFAGTHGVTGFEQFWIGSNAYRITTSAPCPVITVRPDFPVERNIKNILLPLDSSLETKQKLPFAVKLAKGFDAKLHLLKVYNTPLQLIRKRIDRFGNDAETCVKDKEVKFTLETIEVDNVAAGILNYDEKQNIDLIGIMTEQGTTTANKFLGPYAQQLINNSPIPVLSLRAKEYV